MITLKVWIWVWVAIWVSVGLVEAGEDERFCFNELTNDIYSCDYWPGYGIWRGPREVILKQWMAKQPCYIRMQEAMRRMDEHYYGTPVREWEKQAEQQRWLNTHWRQIMKECVQ